MGGTETVLALATDYESNDDLTEWTFTLREGVEFHDGSRSTPTTWSRATGCSGTPHPLHVGREGLFTYWGALFGGFLNLAA